MGDQEVWLPEWDGALYAANTAHHRRYDAAFLATLPLRNGDRVLDLGCGSGDFTAIVAARDIDGEVVGVDPQPTLLAEAGTRAGPNQTFLQGTAQQLGQLFPHGHTFDLIYSRSVLHWVPAEDHPPLLAACRGLLGPGGPLRIECGGGDNVREIVAFMSDCAAKTLGPTAPHCPWNFMGAGAYLDLILEAGYALGENGFVRNVGQRRSFDRDEMLGWMESQAVAAYEVGFDEAARGAFREEVHSRIDELRRADGSYDITYVRLDVLAFAPTAT
jgi:trans-aconitate methyltransferase